jgi:hypothetical protein
VERIQIELMREAPAWRKMELLGQLNEMAELFAMSGLRQRHPEVSDGELRRRLADLVLGPELAERACGPLETEETGRAE